MKKEDLKEFLQRQKKAINNRIEKADLDNAIHALDLRIKTIKDHMVKRSSIHFVSPKDPIGPILLSELHKSGYSCFPVQGNGEHEMVGMLHMDDVTTYTKGGSVAQAMRSDVFYVREDQKLEHVLQAFSQTGQRIFMVLNRQKELVGLITVSDVLEQLFGQSIYGDFIEYADPKAVAQLDQEQKQADTEE